MAGLGRIAFFGTSPFGLPLLRRLREAADEVLVVTQPDRPAGRRLQMRASPIASYAREHGLAVLSPHRLRAPDALDALRSFDPDGLLLAAHGQLVPLEVLDLGQRPPLNVHPSLLPRHRGAAPVAGTILAGDAEAGVSLMVMVEELDAGPVAAQWRVPLGGRETTPELEARLADLAAEVIPAELDRWTAGSLELSPQDPRLVTHVRPFIRADGWIDWRRPAMEIDRRVRALQPWPGAWTTMDGRRIHLRRASPVAGIDDVPIGALLPGDPPFVACGVGALALEIVQPEGRPAMPAGAWRRGLARDHVILGATRPGEAAH